jgi:SAM-dependent methyltransferase
MPTADHFSRQAAQYRASRPGYPPALLEFLARLAPGRERALDCATGNGQAAGGLAAHFAAVVATDLSLPQLRCAAPVANVRYLAARAEHLPLAARTVDLVTVAQALHWFATDAFYAEVRRVARPGAVIAAWSYGLARIDPAVDAVVGRLYRDIVGAYWPPERRLVESGYRDVPFPFEPIAAPAFALHDRWSLTRLLTYLVSWSAVQRYRDATGRDPLDAVRESLTDAWGNPEASRPIAWPLALRIGRVND